MIVTARPSGTILGSLPSAFGGKERDEEDEESSEEEEPSNDEEEGMYESEEEEEEMMAPPPPSVGATATGGGAVRAPWPDGDDSVVPSSAVYCPAGGGRGRKHAANVRIRAGPGSTCRRARASLLSKSVGTARARRHKEGEDDG